MQDLSTDIRIIQMYSAAQPTGASVNTSSVATNLNDSFVIQVTCGAEETALSTTNSIQFRLQHSDTNVDEDFEAVSQDDVVNGKILDSNGKFWELDGNPAGFPGRGGNPGTVGLTFSIGYVGNKKYFRAVILINGTLTTRPLLEICCIASKTKYFEYNDQFSHSSLNDWRIYSEGTAFLTADDPNVYGGDTLWKDAVSKGDVFVSESERKNYYTIERVVSNTHLVLSTSPTGYISYDDGTIGGALTGESVISFTGTEFKTAWNDYVPKLELKITKTGTINNLGTGSITDATTFTLDSPLEVPITAGDEYEIEGGIPLGSVEYKIYKKQWA